MSSTGAAPASVPAIVSYYFLDWRPVGALPIDRDLMTVRYKSIDAADLIQYLKDSEGSTPVAIPQMNLCAGAEVLARQDGLFILRLKVSSGFPPSDIDEMALVACSYVKLRLGHVHDVHRASRTATRSILTPSKVLIVYPVRLPDRGWATRFRNRGFTDEHLQETRCIHPDGSGARESARLALITLRHAYLRIFEDLLGRLAVDRQMQIRWRGGPARFTALLFFLFVAMVLYTLTIQWPGSWPAFVALLLSPSFFIGSLLHDPYFCFALLLGPFLFMGFSHLSEVDRWEVPRIQLLRSAILFYEYANPLNRVICEALRGKLPHQADSFADVVATLKTKTEGEIHRSSQNQSRLAIFLSLVSVVLALLAIKGGQEKAQAQPAAPEKAAVVETAKPSVKPRPSSPPTAAPEPPSTAPAAEATVPPAVTPPPAGQEAPPASAPKLGGEPETPIAAPAGAPAPPGAG